MGPRYHCYAVHDMCVFPPALALVALSAMDIKEYFVAARVLAFKLADFLCLRGCRFRHCVLLTHVHCLSFRHVDDHIGVFEAEVVAVAVTNANTTTTRSFKPTQENKSVKHQNSSSKN